MDLDYQNMCGKFNRETNVWEGVKIPYPALIDTHVSELVIDGLKKTPNRVVQMCYDDGSEMTCDELRLKIIRIAQNLKKLGIKDEDVVGIVCENSMDLMAFTNGIYQLGAIVGAMSVIHCKDDMVLVFQYSKPKLMICDAQVYDTVKEAMNELNNSAPFFTTNGSISGIESIDELLKPSGDEENYQTTKFKDPSNKILALLPSSGTSDHLKGISNTQTMFLKLMTLVPEEETKTISFSAIFWGPAFTALIICPLTNEQRIVTSKPFQPKVFMDVTMKCKASHLILNPTMLTLIVQSPHLATFDTSCVKILTAIGGIFSEDLRAKIKKAFPTAYIMIFYGLTEISCAISYPGQPIDDLTVGYVAPNHLMKIVDDDGKSLDLEESGEILVKFVISPFLGYYNNPKATEESMDSEGFVKTGDIGYIKENGFVYVIDRKKNIFKYKGDHITPSEIESVIEKMEEVEFVTVVGIPNAETYNLPAAVIKKKKGFEKLTENEVIKFVAERMPNYKQLHGGVYFVDEMPMTKNDKILKREALKIALEMFKAKQN